MTPEEAFNQSAESITGPITKTISKKGILDMYNSFDKAAQAEFEVSKYSSYVESSTVVGCACMYACMTVGLFPYHVLFDEMAGGLVRFVVKIRKSLMRTASNLPVIVS